MDHSSLTEIRERIEAWLEEYNAIRSHILLGGECFHKEAISRIKAKTAKAGIIHDTGFYTILSADLFSGDSANQKICVR